MVFEVESRSQRFAMKVQFGGTGFQQELKVMEQMKSKYIVMLEKGEDFYWADSYPKK